MYVISNIYFITAVAVIGGALFGFDIASLSAVLGTQQYKCFFNQLGTQDGRCGGPTPSTQGGISAAMPGGSFVGALVSGILTDWLGRKSAIQVGSVVWCLGSIIVCSSFGIGQLIVGRFINGISVGILSAQVPVYVAELAQPNKRGQVVGGQQWAITWGILIMFYISYGCNYLEGTAAWRVPWGLQMLPAVFLFFMCFILPESPRWLAKKGRWNEAHEVLALVHGKGDLNNRFVQLEMDEIRAMEMFQREHSDASYMDLFRGNMIYRTHIGVFTQTWSQLTGMNVMMLYITYLMGMTGLTGNANLVASSIQYVINVLMTVFALIYIDRWGRRGPLLVGSTLMMTWLFATGGVMKMYGKPAPPGGLDHVPEQSWDISGSPHASKAFAPTWGPVSWIYPPELYPLRLRGKAVALSTSSNWIFNFALSYFVPPAFASIQWKVYLLFGVFCFTMTLHVYFCFPETAGKTLEEVAEVFTTPGMRPWKTTVKQHEVFTLEGGVIMSEKAPDSHVMRQVSAASHHEGAIVTEPTAHTSTNAV